MHANKVDHLGPESWDSIIAQVQESIACDAMGVEGPLKLQWNDDGEATRRVFASKSIKEVYDFRTAFSKLTLECRRQLFDELKVLPFAAQVRRLKEMSRTQMGLVEISDHLFFRWVVHPPEKFARQLFRCVQTFCECSVFLEQEQQDGLVAKLSKLTLTEQAFCLTFICQATVSLEKIADDYYFRHKPSYRLAQKELMRQELGVDVLAQYTVGEKAVHFGDLDDIIGELVVADSKELRELLQLQNSQSRESLRDFLHNLLSLQAYSNDGNAIAKLVRDHAPAAGELRESELSKIASGLRSNDELLSAMLNVFRKEPSHLFDFLSALLDHWTRFFAKGSNAHTDLLLAQCWTELELFKDQEIPDLLSPHTGATPLNKLPPDEAQKEVNRLAMRRKRLGIKRAS